MTDDVEDLDAKEADRIKRRDRDAQAAQRALLRPGMAKVFKQIQDAQRKVADALADDQSSRDEDTDRKGARAGLKHPRVRRGREGR